MSETSERWKYKIILLIIGLLITPFIAVGAMYLLPDLLGSWGIYRYYYLEGREGFELLGYLGGLCFFSVLALIIRAIIWPYRKSIQPSIWRPIYISFIFVIWSLLAIIFQGHSDHKYLGALGSIITTWLPLMILLYIIELVVYIFYKGRKKAASPQT